MLCGGGAGGGGRKREKCMRRGCCNRKVTAKDCHTYSCIAFAFWIVTFVSCCYKFAFFFCFLLLRSLLRHRSLLATDYIHISFFICRSLFRNIHTYILLATRWFNEVTHCLLVYISCWIVIVCYTLDRHTKRILVRCHHYFAMWSESLLS